MLPLNAKEIRPRQVAIVFDDDNKGIQIWRNSVSNPEFHPFWYLDKIATLSEFDKLFPPDTLPDNVEEALIWFWHDHYGIDDDHAAA